MAAPQRDLPLAVAEPGWRRPRLAPSLAEVYRTVPVSTGAWWRKALAFAGPGYLVAVGYMDPGNWATDLAGGSRFGYALLSVILLSNLMAILLQGLAAKLGIVTGRDLAQACRDHYSRPTALALWVLCEVAIAACDLAEVIGSAIGLNLLFGIPLPWGIAITALDVLIVLFLQNKGFRLLEALVVALFINAAILIVAAATFHRAGHTAVAEIQEAYQLLTPLLGVAGASAVFALALLASGQNSTLTGTLAGQIVMEGFLNIRIRPWLRRLITRLIAIVPAALTAIFFGESGTAKLLILSQVILSLQLSFAVFPLVWFTSDRLKMGEFVNPTWVKALAYLVAVVIAGLNAWLLAQIFRGWLG